MKRELALLAVLFSTSANAQDLPEKPKAQRYVDPTVPITLGPLIREKIDPSAPIPEGMVWNKEGTLWVARKINSCDLCGRPMTFKQAAFDKKAIEMWGAGLALGTANAVVAATRPCVQHLACRDALGRPTIGRGMAIQSPSLIAAWIGTAFLRKGNVKYHKGGLKEWWIFPMMYQGVEAAFMGANLARY